MNHNDYKFEQLYKDLRDGYQIYYTYMGIRYLLSKLNQNCYSKEIVEFDGKGPHPKTQIVTLKTVMELHPFITDYQMPAQPTYGASLWPQRQVPT